jgi:hypothetical protein
MNVRHHPALSYRGSIFVATIFALCLWVPSVSAQFSRNRPLERELRQRNAEQMREMEIKRLENALNKKPIPDMSPSLPYLQIREDFRQIQIVHNEMMAAAFSVKPQDLLNYKGISKATAEINKRAVRLKSTLQLPKPQIERTQGLDEMTNDAQLKVSLLALDNLIMKFVLNPSFGHAGVVDAQESAKASQDLIRIIELTRHIRQNSARLAGSRN